MDGARWIVAAGVAAEEPHVAVGPETAVLQPDAAKVVLEGERKGRVAGVREARDLRRRALVGVDGQDPIAAGFAAGELMLAGKVVERPFENARAGFGGELARAIS